MDQYIKDRDEMLMKCDVDEFKKFVHKYEHMFPPQYLLLMDITSDEVILTTIHKLIVDTKSMPKDLQNKSLEWLNKCKHKLPF